MKNDNGLIFAYLLDGHGGGKKVNWQEIKSWQETDGLLWVHLDCANQSVKKWLKIHVSNQAVIEALMSEDVRPRSLKDSHTLYACLRCLNINPEEDEEDMVSVRFFVTDRLIITARVRHTGLFKNISDEIEKNQGPKSSFEMFAKLSAMITRNISNYINDLADEVDDYEDKYLENPSSLDKNLIADIRRKILFFKRHLSPQKEALRLLSAEEINMSVAQYRSHLQENYNTTTRVLEELELARERCALLQEQMSNRLTEQVNQKMYLFSLITAIFIPISTVAGIFGMNLGGIPGANTPWAFGVTCVSMVTMSLILILYLKKKNWF